MTNYYYYEQGSETPRGFARLAPVIQPTTFLIRYAPELIGEHALKDEQIKDSESLSRRATTLEEAKRSLESWAARKNFRLVKVD